MSVVNFSITDELAKSIEKVIRRIGFSSRAEFFRMAAIHFMNEHMKGLTEEEKFSLLSDEINRAFHKKFKNKKIPSIEEQLANL